VREHTGATARGHLARKGLSGLACAIRRGFQQDHHHRVLVILGMFSGWLWRSPQTEANPQGSHAFLAECGSGELTIVPHNPGNFSDFGCDNQAGEAHAGPWGQKYPSRAG